MLHTYRQRHTWKRTGDQQDCISMRKISGHMYGRSLKSNLSDGTVKYDMSVDCLHVCTGCYFTFAKVRAYRNLSDDPLRRMQSVYIFLVQSVCLFCPRLRSCAIGVLLVFKNTAFPTAAWNILGTCTTCNSLSIYFTCPGFTWKSESQAKFTGHFSPIIPSFADRGLSRCLHVEAPRGESGNV